MRDPKALPDTMNYYLEIDSKYSLSEPAAHEALLETWYGAVPNLFPTHYAVNGPARQRIDPANIRSMARDTGGSGWIVRRSDPNLKAGLLPGIRGHGSFWIEVSSGDRDFTIADDLRTLFARLTGLLLPDYGTLHSLTSSEEAEALAVGRPDLAILHLATMSTSLTTGQTRPLLSGLKSLYWINQFGPAYIELFGRHILLNAPATSIVEEPDSVELTLSPRPPVDSSYAEFAQRRNDVIEYLGRDAFWPSASRVPDEFRDFAPRPWATGPPPTPPD